MRTNKIYTFNILHAYAGENEFDFEYFANLVIRFGDNFETIYWERFNKDRTTKDLAIFELISFLNFCLKNAEYPEYFATYAQVQEYDKKHGEAIAKALEIIEANIIDTRKNTAWFN